MNIRRALGVDGPVAYTLLARLVNIMGSTGTVLLIVNFLSPVEQGYYYTLLSLVSLYMVFELGFSFVIQQLAAHECAHVKLHPDGRVTGDPVAHARLASTLQLSLRWYTVASVIMGLILAPLGFVFFARHVTGTAPVAWHGPWLLAVAGLVAFLWCMPFYAFLEGCGYVRAVAEMRLRQAVVSSVLAWTALLAHRGLYSPAMMIAGQVGTGLLFLAAHRRLFAGLLRRTACEAAVCWNREVWPFQWRIAVSWTCSCYTLQAFVPLLFALRGPVEAGQIGISLSITGYMTGLALSWSSTKITPFGQMIERHEFQRLDRLFFRSLGQSLSVFGMLALCAGGVTVLLPLLAPRLAARMVSPLLFAALVLAAAANCVVQSLAILLRSFKREPFLIQSIAVAALTLLLAVLTAARWGNTGVIVGYLAATAVIGLPVALTIFVRARRGYLAIDSLAPCKVETG